MNARTPEEIVEIRRKAAALEFRAKCDAAFFQQLKDDPVRTLEAEGFDDPMAREMTSQLQGTTVEAAVAAHCIDCDPLTCIFTGCCWFTTEEPVTLPEA